MLGIAAGMNQKDCSWRDAARYVVSGSGMHTVGFPGSLRAVFPVVADRPRCSASWSVWTRRTRMQVAGFVGDDASRAVFLPWLSGPDPPHHGQYAPEGQLCALRSRQWHVHHGLYGPEGQLRCETSSRPLCATTVAVSFRVRKIADFSRLQHSARSSTQFSQTSVDDQLLLLLNLRKFNYRKEVDGQLLSQPCWSHCLSYEYEIRKDAYEMCRLRPIGTAAA